MNSILITVGLVILCVVGGYWLGQFWLPLGYIGFIAAFVVIGLSIFGKNRRIQ
jgi:hypothetical protein